MDPENLTRESGQGRSQGNTHVLVTHKEQADGEEKYPVKRVPMAEFAGDLGLDVEYDEETETLYLVDGEGERIGGGAELPEGRDGEDAVLLRVDSSKGLVFKHNQVVTILSVTIYKGSQIITDADTMHSVFGIGSYIQWSWMRLNDESYGIIPSSDSRITDGGFKFRLSPEDVDVKVTFQCALIVP